jgi:hypothetical protein
MPEARRDEWPAHSAEHVPLFFHMLNKDVFFPSDIARYAALPVRTLCKVDNS